MMSIQQLVNQLKNSNQDFEFYPTTNTMIDVINERLSKIVFDNDMQHLVDLEKNRRILNILDIGAGDGATLNKFHSYRYEINRFAIEKSSILRERWDNKILLMGTDFQQVSLTDKNMDIVFCNPPYSSYEEWAARIIREATCSAIYLILPKRWRNSRIIQRALNIRGLSEAFSNIDALEKGNHNHQMKSLGDFDFLEAEREARAKVEIVEILFNCNCYIITTHVKYSCSFQEQFASYFKAEQLKFESAKNAFKSPVLDYFSSGRLHLDNSPKTENNNVEESENSNSQADLFDMPEPEEKPFSLLDLVQEYEQESIRITQTFKSISTLSPDLCALLDIDVNVCSRKLLDRLRELKKVYWEAVLFYYKPIQERLLSSYKQKLLGVLMMSNLDFTLDNIYATTIRVIQNSSKYIDDQMLDMFDKLANKNNIKSYKSNEKLFSQNKFRYMGTDDDFYYTGAIKNKEISHYQLEYRLVKPNYGAIDYSNHLSYEVVSFLYDLKIIAENFSCFSFAEDFFHQLGKGVFYYGELYTLNCFYKGQEAIFLKFRLYRNGNIHLFLHHAFLLKMNVRVGYLRGWIKNTQEAMDDIHIDKKAMKEHGVDMNQVESIVNEAIHINNQTMLLNNSSLLPMLPNKY